MFYGNRSLDRQQRFGAVGDSNLPVVKVTKYSRQRLRALCTQLNKGGYLGQRPRSIVYYLIAYRVKRTVWSWPFKRLPMQE